jgi:hypothetical protein
MTKTAATESIFIVRYAAAKMPTSCWGTYRRVAVLEVERGTKPAMISERATGVIRVVETWERLHVGKTARCAYSRAYAEAEELAAELNGSESRWRTRSGT